MRIVGAGILRRYFKLGKYLSQSGELYIFIFRTNNARFFLSSSYLRRVLSPAATRFSLPLAMRVPIEIVLDIFDALAASDDAHLSHSYSVCAHALRTCSLVCRAWALPAQRCLVCHWHYYFYFPLFSHRFVFPAFVIFKLEMRQPFLVSERLSGSSRTWRVLHKENNNQTLPSSAISSQRDIDAPFQISFSRSMHSLLCLARKFHISGPVVLPSPSGLFI